MLAAIATIADMMPLWEENRILVRLGLKYLNERQFTAIEALNEKKCELWTEKEVCLLYTSSERSKPTICVW